jgi:threonine synthase
MKTLGFACVRCGREHSPRRAEYDCPSCGGNLQVRYDYARIKKVLTRESLSASREGGIWRYLPLLPVSGRRVPAPLVGATPLLRARKLGRDLGLSGLFLKDETRNPSASLKDRAGAVFTARALDRGERIVTGASTGNAAASLACLCAGGPRAVIFVPRTAPEAKLAQLLLYGAVVISVDGSYDEAFDLCLKASREYGWYNRNTGYNPLTREGKKTTSFEIAEQLGWRSPDWVFVPAGDGNILSGVWKGFTDFHRLGLIDALPRLAAVQAEGSDAIARAFEGDGRIRPASGRTLADSISVSLPRDGEAAVAALRESKGIAVRVTDSEMLGAMRETARAEGVFAEPAAAAAVAGLRKAAAQGRLGGGETVVALITGSGLKDVASARKAAGEPHRIAPDLGSLRSLVKKLSL